MNHLGGLNHMKRVIKQNPRFREYLEYIDAHRIGVIRSWEEILSPFIEQNYKDVNIQEISAQIASHDLSKYEPDEFNAYCNYFYPSDGFEKDEEAFDMAWLLHQHRNPHHPQYWILVRDEGEIVALDMEFKYICEALCDWHSFSSRDPKSTAYKWWTDNRDKMTLSENTTHIIEDLIECFKEPLSKTDE